MSKPINSREKGAAAEREFAQLIRDLTGWVLLRNLDQSRGGGYDLLAAEDCPLNLFAIEIKRHAVVRPHQVNEWWEQATQQAIKAGKMPLLACRADRGKWRVIVPVHWLSGNPHHYGTAELSLSDFAATIVAMTDRPAE